MAAPPRIRRSRRRTIAKRGSHHPHGMNRCCRPARVRPGRSPPGCMSNGCRKSRQKVGKRTRKDAKQPKPTSTENPLATRISDGMRCNSGYPFCLDTAEATGSIPVAPTIREPLACTEDVDVPRVLAISDTSSVMSLVSFGFVCFRVPCGPDVDQLATAPVSSPQAREETRTIGNCQD